MQRILVTAAIAVSCVLAWVKQTHAASPPLVDLSPLKLLKEPGYQSTPRYSLLIIGDTGAVKVWMVEDGRRLFVDKNANGDLTDDGSPIEPSNVRSVGAKGWDLEYLLDAISPANGSRHTSFNLRCWNYDDKEDSYGLSLSVDGRFPMYAGWFGTFWSGKPETVPVLHFGGPFTPTLLRSKEFTIGAGQGRLSLAFMNSVTGRDSQTRISIEALPKDLVPRLNIEWPAAGNAPALRTSHALTERCCYWEFYNTKFEVPAGAVVGKAKVSVELPTTNPPVVMTTTEFEVPVVAPTAKSESVR